MLCYQFAPLLPLQMRWYLDSYNFYTARPASASSDSPGWWTAGEGAGPSSPFDTPFFLVSCLMGGAEASALRPAWPLGAAKDGPVLSMCAASFSGTARML